MNPTHGADRDHDQALAADDQRHCWIEKRAEMIFLDWQTELAIDGIIDWFGYGREDLQHEAKEHEMQTDAFIAMKAGTAAAWEWDQREKGNDVSASKLSQPFEDY